MIVCGGLPIMVLEFGLGQYMSKGGLKCWVICPLFQGISMIKDAFFKGLQYHKLSFFI
jgi:hypothetical protein